ncbi:MAG: helix-turn-helix domain-containing protein [Verrucomicrobiales bacterium]
MNIRAILTLEEVAAILKTSVKTVRRRIASGKLRSFKEGGRVRVLESDLEDYIRRQLGGAFSA